jgi:hypothetical protein
MGVQTLLTTCQCLFKSLKPDQLYPLIPLCTANQTPEARLCRLLFKTNDLKDNSERSYDQLSEINRTKHLFFNGLRQAILASIHILSFRLYKFWSSQRGSNPRSRDYESRAVTTIPGGSPNQTSKRNKEPKEE